MCVCLVFMSTIVSLQYMVDVSLLLLMLVMLLVSSLLLVVLSRGLLVLVVVVMSMPLFTVYVGVAICR